MSRSLPPLYALRAFEAAARHSSFTRAGEELSITQSAVSRHIKTLEAHVACRLFQRNGRSLQLTEAAREVLKGQRQVQLRRPVKRKSAQPSRSSTVAVDLSAADADLFQILRQWRADTAREQGVPAYVILHDKTLRELAETRPVSHGLLAGITGMGSAKIEHYGQELLTLIREHAA